MRTVRIWAATHTGAVRLGNEDYYGATSLTVSHTDGEVVSAVVYNEPCLAVVADGLGGHPCGEVASRLAVEYLLDAKPTGPAELVAAFHEANAAIFRAMDRERGSVGMGTTAAALLVLDSGIVVVNVGDSPVFECVDERLVQLSIDDVPEGCSPIPGLSSGAITQTLGGGPTFRRIDPHVHLDDFGSTSRRFLLCTDGLSSYVPRDQICQSLQRHDGINAVRDLLLLAETAGGRDNVTVVIVEK